MISDYKILVLYDFFTIFFYYLCFSYIEIDRIYKEYIFVSFYIEYKLFIYYVITIVI